jgi:hypothetical protein
MSGLIDWESCDTRTGRACHRGCHQGRAGMRNGSVSSRGRVRRDPALAEFAILRPVFRSARASAARIRCRRSARRSSMDRTSAS